MLLLAEFLFAFWSFPAVFWQVCSCQLLCWLGCFLPDVNSTLRFLCEWLTNFSFWVWNRLGGVPFFRAWRVQDIRFLFFGGIFCCLLISLFLHRFLFGIWAWVLDSWVWVFLRHCRDRTFLSLLWFICQRLSIVFVAFVIFRDRFLQVPLSL